MITLDQFNVEYEYLKQIISNSNVFEDDDFEIIFGYYNKILGWWIVFTDYPTFNISWLGADYAEALETINRDFTEEEEEEDEEV